jgi:hypothetical protein
LSRTALTIEQILALLVAAPSQITEYTSELTEAQLHAAPGSVEWSANEVLAHLRSCADVWGGSIMKIIEQDRPTIRAINPRTWIKSTNYLEQKFRPSLQAFSDQRAELLVFLLPLKPAAWRRSALVTGAGKPLETSVHSYAERMAIHERRHLIQIKQIADRIGDS